MRLKPLYKCEFPGANEQVDRALKEALDVLIQHNWIDEEQVFYARLCLEEGLVNAVQHGNKGNAALEVGLEIYEEDDYCIIRIRDQGAGFHAEDVSMPECSALRGRGICLIRYCMDEVNYDPATRSLVMKMRRKALCKGGAENE